MVVPFESFPSIWALNIDTHQNLILAPLSHVIPTHYILSITVVLNFHKQWLQNLHVESKLVYWDSTVYSTAFLTS